MTLDQFITYSQTFLAEDKLDDLFEFISGAIRKDTRSYEDYILLSAEYSSIKKQILRGTISHEDQDLKLARIRGKLINLLKNLQTSFLSITANENIIDRINLISEGGEKTIGCGSIIM